MPGNNNVVRKKSVLLDMVQPYNFLLSLRAVNSFQPTASEDISELLIATRIDGTPSLIKVTEENGKNAKLDVTSIPEVNERSIRRIAEWVIFSELDLTPFYNLANQDRKLLPIIKRLYGLKPMRPVSLFEMAVIAITEQQISLAAAYKIRSRIIQKFGESIDNQWIFPEPQMLAKVSIEELRSLGLSRQKAQYIQELAAKIAAGTLDLDILKKMDEDDARQKIMSLRGFGQWSADYILVRGLARPDCVPIDDLAIRSVVGEYLGRGQRATSNEVTKLLNPFKPYRGLLAFYLLTNHRLRSTNP